MCVNYSSLNNNQWQFLHLHFNDVKKKIILFSIKIYFWCKVAKYSTLAQACIHLHIPTVWYAPIHRHICNAFPRAYIISIISKKRRKKNRVLSPLQSSVCVTHTSSKQQDRNIPPPVIKINNIFFSSKIIINGRLFYR